MITASEDHAVDRGRGQLWERRFCEMVTALGGKVEYSHIPGFGEPLRPSTCCDVVITSPAGRVEYHEVKDKAPCEYRVTGAMRHGLEVYRLEALAALGRDVWRSGARVYYTIHDPTIDEWRAAPMEVLVPQHDGEGQVYTWYGNATEQILKSAYFWDVERFRPLAEVWA